MQNAQTSPIPAQSLIFHRRRINLLFFSISRISMAPDNSHAFSSTQAAAALHKIAAKFQYRKTTFPPRPHFCSHHGNPQVAFTHRNP